MHNLDLAKKDARRPNIVTIMVIKIMTMKKISNIIKVSTLVLIVLVDLSCSKKHDHKISGRFINATTKKGLPGEGFEIIQSTDRGWFTSLDKRTVVKSTNTDAEGYFDFGVVTLKKSGEGSFSVGNSTSDWQTDIYKFAGAATINLGESTNYYNFFVVPAFKRLYINFNKISNLNPGDTLTYSLLSQYLQETNDLNSFVIKGGSGNDVPTWSTMYYKGPTGNYIVNIYKKINNVVTNTQDTLFLDKGQEFTYTINF